MDIFQDFFLGALGVLGGSFNFLLTLQFSCETRPPVFLRRDEGLYFSVFPDQTCFQSNRLGRRPHHPPTDSSGEILMAKPYLTERQAQIARLISLGCSNLEMADILGLAVNTVDNHRVRLYEAMGTDKAVLITRLAIKYRFTSMKDKLTRSEKRKSGRKQDGWN